MTYRHSRGSRRPARHSAEGPAAAHQRHQRHHPGGGQDRPAPLSPPCSATSTSLTVVQSEFDAAIRGRALGVFNALGNLGMPIGMVAFGPLADVIPVSWVFLIGGALTVPVGAWLFGYACRHPVAGSPVSGLALEQA